MKKLASILLAMVMVLSMTMTAFAAGTHTITAPNDGHSYEVYQIFTGDLSQPGQNDEVKLSNVKWGTNGTGTTGTEVDDATLEALAAVVGKADKEKLAVIEGYVDLDSTPVAVLNAEKGLTATVADGYYLIKDVDGSVTGDDTYTTYIVEIVANVTINRKAEKPTSEKKVKDTCDTTGAITNWQDSADYHIGDVIPFQLKGTVAEDYENYDTYYFAFHDKEETGLTFNPNSVVVYHDIDNDDVVDEGEELTAGTDYQLVTNPTDGDTFDVVFANLKNVAGITGGSVIKVEYTSTLNENAIIGSMGNVNDVYLEFSNNPNDEQGGEPHGKTPHDTVIIFTYKVEVNKYANSVAEENKLDGADFALEMKVNNEWVRLDEIKTTAGNVFTFTGLDDGDYRLVETTTPDGYNSIDPIEFTVTAEHDVIWETQDREDVLTSLTGDVATGEIEFTSDKDAGKLSVDIINKSGTVLPETGGMGTTLFYVFGTILVVGAAVVLVTKKRMTGVK